MACTVCISLGSCPLVCLGCCSKRKLCHPISHHPCCLADDPEVVILDGAHAELHSHVCSAGIARHHTLCILLKSDVLNIGKAGTNWSTQNLSEEQLVPAGEGTRERAPLLVFQSAGAY